MVGDLLSEELAIEEKEERITRTLERERLAAFGEVDVVYDVISGIVDVSQANGFGGLDSNTILLGWPKDAERMIEFLQVVHRLERLHKSVVIGHIQTGLILQGRDEPVIHVWWGGSNGTAI